MENQIMRINRQLINDAFIANNPEAIKVKVVDLTFHKLRTTYTTILAKNDFSMKAISKLLGHSSMMITFENYTDKNVIIQDCLQAIEPFIDKVIEAKDKQIIDCTNLKTDVMMQECYHYFVS